MVLSVLGIRAFLLLWLGQIFSQISINMMNFVLILRTFQLTSSNTAVSGLVLSFSAPAVVVGLLAGVFVDRRDKKQILLLTNALRGLLVLLLIFFGQSVPLIYLIVFLVALVTLFFVPAEAYMIPRLVPKRLLLPANAVFTISLYASILIGYILAGPFLKILGPRYIFVFISLLFLLAAMFISFVGIKPDKRGVGIGINHFSLRVVRRVSADLSEGFKLFRKSKNILESLLLLSFSQVIILILGALLPGYAKNLLAIEIEDLSFLLFAPAALGMVLGALIVGHIGNRFSRKNLITFGILVSGIIISILPFSNRLASKFLILKLNAILPATLEIDILQIVIFLAVILGIANAFITVCANTILQGETNEDLRGRVYGAFTSFSALLSVVPVLAAGGLADIFGVGKILTSIGMLIVFAGLYRSIIVKYTG